MSALPATEQLFLDDAYLTEFSAEIVAVEGDQVALDRTAFYATSGGQQHDTGTIDGQAVVGVARRDGVVWHTIVGTPPMVGAQVVGQVDWERRHANMRTHT